MSLTSRGSSKVLYPPMNENGSSASAPHSAWFGLFYSSPYLRTFYLKYFQLAHRPLLPSLSPGGIFGEGKRKKQKIKPVGDERWGIGKFLSQG